MDGDAGFSISRFSRHLLCARMQSSTHAQDHGGPNNIIRKWDCDVDRNWKNYCGISDSQVSQLDIRVSSNIVGAAIFPLLVTLLVLWPCDASKPYLLPRGNKVMTNIMVAVRV